MTIVAAWIRALTGVGPSIASGSQVWSGSCADFATAPPSRPSATSVSTVVLSPPAFANTSAEVERARLLDQQEERERHRRVAERVHDERLLGGGDRARPLVVEADQQVRREPDEAPADQQEEQVPALDEHQHREDEQRHVREVPALLVLAVHVADRVGDDQRPDAGDDQHHHDRERVGEDREADAEVPGDEPVVQAVESLRAVLGRAAEHLAERDDRGDERPAAGERRDPAGRPPRDRGAEQRDQRRRRRAAGRGRSRRRRSSTAQGRELVDVEVELLAAPSRRSGRGRRRPRRRRPPSRSSAKIWPSPFAKCRENAISARFAAVQHDLEREQHDQRAAADEHAERAGREQERGDDQVTGDVRPEHRPSLRRGSACEWLPRITPPTAATSSTTEVISNASRWSVRNSCPISPGLPNESVDLRRAREPPVRLVGDHDHDLDEERTGGDDRRPELCRSCPLCPGRVRLPAEVGDHEQEHDHHRARVDEHLRGGDELGREQQVEHRERAEVPDQRERRVERVREADHRDRRTRGTQPAATTQTTQTSAFEADARITNASGSRGSACRTRPGRRPASS